MSSIRYEVIGPLQSGEGSRASLGLRIEPDGQSHSAVFVWVPEQVLLSEEKLRVLQKDTARAKQLVHPNITRVFGLAELEGKVARVVDFTDGETLRTILKAAKHLPPMYAARVAADAATGLHYAHLAGNDDGSPLVHGDLRPETLMVSLNGVTKVAGYGALSVAPKETNGKRVVGRRLYCAPEQVLHGRAATTPQTDVFLLGMVLYECLTGKRPFSRRIEHDTAVISEAIPPVYLPSVPEGLNHVIKRATAKNPKERYATPLQFREELELAVGELPSQELFAAYLLNFYPDVMPPHLFRRHQLEVAILRGSPVTAPVEPAIEISPPPAPALAAKPIPKAKPKTPARGSPRHIDLPEPELLPPPPRPRSWGWVAAAAAVTVGGVLLYSKSLDRPVPVHEEVALVQSPSAPAPTAPPPVATPAPVTAAGGFSVRTDPVTEVLISGKSKGRTPVDLPRVAGKYKLQFRDDAKAINTFRTLTINSDGTATQDYKFGKGSIVVKAPAGAKSVVDGRPGGEGSFTLPLYEGYHHIVVQLGNDKWEDTFRVGTDEKLEVQPYFDPPSAADKSQANSGGDSPTG